MGPIEDIQVLVVGAGFNGLAMLYELKQAGFEAKCLERASEPGGVWSSPQNTYPGACVDVPYPHYQFSYRQIWDHWTVENKYSTREEIARYFNHAVHKLEIEDAIRYNAEVISAVFDDVTRKWTITCKDGSQIRCQYFIPALGNCTKPYIPSFRGLDLFKGVLTHSATWPENGIELKCKRVAVIGTGSSGTQIIETIAPYVGHLTVYQRTMNIALPAMAKPMSADLQAQHKQEGVFDHAFNNRRTSVVGFPCSSQMVLRNTFNDTEGQRQAVYETAWSHGGFGFYFGYQDMFLDPKANEEAYQFWLTKTRPRIHDPAKRDILTPLKMPYAWGSKRPAVEKTYYEAFNRPNVDLIDISWDPIQEFSETGIQTVQSGLRDYDVVILATGFDAITGGLTQMDIIGPEGLLRESWANGVHTHLGITSHGYPNMLFLHGPQSPGPFGLAPTIAEMLAVWVVDLLKDMKTKGLTRFEATVEAEKEWKDALTTVWDMTLYRTTDSYYNGANIPGKYVEPLAWIGGVPSYCEAFEACKTRGWKGLVFDA